MDWHTRINQIAEEMDRKYAEESNSEARIMRTGEVYSFDPAKEEISIVCVPVSKPTNSVQGCGVWVCNVGEPCDVS